MWRNDPDLHWERRLPCEEAAQVEQERHEGLWRVRLQRRVWRLWQAVRHPGRAIDPCLRAQGLTRAQERAYDRWQEEQYQEHLAQEAAGGRTVCPECGQRSVVHRSVVTLGYAGHPGAEYSDYGKCEMEGCDHACL